MQVGKEIHQWHPISTVELLNEFLNQNARGYVSCHFGEKSLYFQEGSSDPENGDEKRASNQRSLSIKHNSNNIVV